MVSYKYFYSEKQCNTDYILENKLRTNELILTFI